MRAELHFYLFGSPRLERAGKVVDIDTRKALALLAYLVLGESGPSGGYTRDALAALLYPDADQVSARGALRRTLSALRKALGEEILQTDREHINVPPQGLWVDVIVFRENLSRIKGHRHAPGQACPECLRRLKENIDLYAGGFMTGFSLRDSPTFDDWQFYQADTLRQELAGALDMISYELAAQEAYEAAIVYARHWLSLDHLREEAQRRLMLTYVWSGQRNAALRQYRECVRVLNHELGVAPLQETTRLYQDLLENRVPPAPHELKTAPVTPAAVLGTPAGKAENKAYRPVPPAGLESFPLVGRQVEWEKLLQAYQAVGAKGYWLALEGEAGIGKTRLSDEFLQHIQTDSSAAVMRARCYEGESGLAYAPFLDALNTALAQPGAASRLEGLPPEEIGPAAQLLPVLRQIFADLPPAPSSQTPGAQAHFFDALRLIISRLLGSDPDTSAPGILFLDDLQWADSASIDLLSFLIRRMNHVFILTAWRSDAILVDHRLRQLLGQICREERASGLSLPRLRLEDMAAFLGNAQDRLEIRPEFLEHLYTETEGNPFFIKAYAESILEEVRAGEKFAWELPLSVRDLLQARLSGIGEMNWQILTAAAVIGRAFSFPILREVSGRSELEMIEGLEALMQQNLIAEQRAGETPTYEALYDFTHDKLRSLVLEQTSLARCRLLHQRAAAAYAGQARLRREVWAQAANHYRQAGQLPQAAECFRQAGEVARSLYANHEALEHYQSALACDDPQPASLHEVIGDLRALLGEYQAALVHYETAAALCTPEQLPGIEHKLGMIHSRRGNWELAECHYQSVLEEIEALPGYENHFPGRRAMIYADWSLAAYRQGETSRALELARQALKLSQECQVQTAMAQAYNILGILERASGHPEQAIENLQRSLEIAGSLKDLAAQAAALNNLARVYADTNRHSQAIELTEQALALCDQRGDRHRAAALHNNLADLYHTLRDQQRTMDHLLKAVVMFADIEGWGEVQASKPLREAENLPVPAERLPEIWKLTEW